MLQRVGLAIESVAPLVPSASTKDASLQCLPRVRHRRPQWPVEDDVGCVRFRGGDQWTARHPRSSTSMRILAFDLPPDEV